MGSEFALVGRSSFEEFEWDETKRLRTLEARKLDFIDAVQLFENFHIERAADRHGEARWLAIGVIANGEILAVIYTLRGDKCRVISARKARNNERHAYLYAISTPPNEGAD